MITPCRHYFLFGSPISTAALEPTDRDGCARVYAELKQQVTGGISRLMEVRAADEFREPLPRTAWEALYDETAPGPAAFEQQAPRAPTRGAA